MTNSEIYIIPRELFGLGEHEYISWVVTTIEGYRKLIGAGFRYNTEQMEPGSLEH